MIIENQNSKRSINIKLSMQILYKFYLIVSCIVFSAVFSYAQTTIFISPDGKDTKFGTKEKLFVTTGKAQPSGIWSLTGLDGFLFRPSSGGDSIMASSKPGGNRRFGSKAVCFQATFPVGLDPGI
jgi:hypothetical protein